MGGQDVAPVDSHRRSKQFTTKKEADAFAATAAVEVREGVHIPDSVSRTVAYAGNLWVASAEAAGLERSTIAQYRQHLGLHIVPFIGNTLLSKVTVPTVRAFEDRLRAEGRSPAMTRKVLASLSTLLADAQERGLVTRNVARDLRRRRSPDRHDRRGSRLKVGIDIPTPAEVRAIVHAATGRWRPLLITAIFTGLRSSELRGLRWADVDLEGKVIHVRQRADRYNEIGRPKSEASERTIPLSPIVVHTLREWRLRCPKRDTGRSDGDGNTIWELHFVFPNGAGNIESHIDIVKRGLIPTLEAAGVVVPVLAEYGRPILDGNGRPKVRAKYTGLHALRHWYASWCINRIADGGLGLPPKTVQARLGHSTIGMLMDTYGHLFPEDDDAAALAEGERALLG